MEVHSQTKVAKITPEYVQLAGADGESHLPAKAVLWGAGLQSSAAPEHRYHQRAARSVLRDLLPDSGTNLR